MTRPDKTKPNIRHQCHIHVNALLLTIPNPIRSIVAPVIRTDMMQGLYMVGMRAVIVAERGLQPGEDE